MLAKVMQVGVEQPLCTYQSCHYKTDKVATPGWGKDTHQLTPNSEIHGMSNSSLSGRLSAGGAFQRLGFEEPGLIRSKQFSKGVNAN